MIPRTACRAQVHQPLQIFAGPSTPLTLPWLAPAQLRWIASQQLATKPDVHRTRSTSCRPSTRSRRRIGTVHGGDIHGSNVTSDDAFPALFRGRQHDQKNGWDFDKLSAAGHDNQYVMLDRNQDDPGLLYRMPNKLLADGEELLQHLYTSLRVGKLDRARSIVDRITKRNTPEAAIVTNAHAVFLEGSLDAILQSPKRSSEALRAYRIVQTWFTSEIRDRGVVLDSSILTAMIRGAIHTLDDTECSATIREFIKTASRASEQVFDDVLFSDDYTDAEADVVDKIASDFIEQDESLQHADEPVPEALQPSPKKRNKRSKYFEPVDMSSLEDVLGTQSVGGGLFRVQQAIAALHELPALAEDASPADQKERALTRQKLAEEAAVDIAIRKWKDADAQLKKIGINTVMQTKPISALMWQWYSALLPALEAEREACRAMTGQHDGVDMKNLDRIHYGLYLELVPLPQVAANTILFVCSKLLNYKSEERHEFDVKITTLCDGLGKLIESEAAAEEQTQRFSTGNARHRSHRLAAQRRHRLSQQSFKDRANQRIDAQTRADLVKAWPKTVKIKFGAILVEKLLETAQLPVTREHPKTKQRVTQMQPAFVSRTKYHQGMRSGVLSVNPAFIAKLQSEPVFSLLAKRMPMIVEPRPWKGYADGGYYHYPTEIMRIATPKDGCKDYFIAAHQRGDMDQIYSGLNALSKVPWRINYDVFKVQLDAWNSGEALANLAPLHPKFVLPPEPDPSAGVQARRAWLGEIRDLENKKTGIHSQRCFQNFQMEVARAMLNETMYFPHNMDFRGRAYPVPPYLNHMGADNARALLVFAEGKELGVEGLRWLKIHLANVAGYDKASLQDREDFTMAHLEDIRDSVRDPLGGKKWWLKSDDAWQTLAACYELINALDTADPTKFVSHLPIHQDGTCNGLQHYAALGGDSAGAAHVNLEPGEKPADVYSAVAAGVAEAVARDAAARDPIAKLLDGHIGRKVVKQTVMTNVYGVTHYGARAQVRKQLEDLFPDIGREADINHRNMAAYVTSKIFDLLGSLFTGAQAIQHWLEICAERICSCLTPEQIDQLLSDRPDRIAAKKRAGTLPLETKRAKEAFKPLFKSTVVWTTPLRLPVVQPYRSARSKQIPTSLQAMTIKEPRLWDPVARQKQLQAFPPNFIHSLDATHMLMSASKCDEVGVTFASIHDSFWTHASDISKMGTILRDAFVAMHSEDVIGRLNEEFQTRYKDCMYLESVPMSSDVAKRVKDWRHNMKIRKSLDELKLEVERMRLLRSSDAEERIRGAQMVTPGSIYESRKEDGLVPRQGRPATLPKSSNSMHDIGAEMADVLDESAILESETPAKEEEADDAFDEDRLVSKARSADRKLHIWLPMSFPSVPKRGDFDVTRLRQSKYFFH